MLRLRQGVAQRTARADIARACQIEPAPGHEADAPAVVMGEHAIAVVLDLVQPLGPNRRRRRGVGRQGLSFRGENPLLPGRAERQQAYRVLGGIPAAPMRRMGLARHSGKVTRMVTLIL
jgi:hypothetical protein